MNARLVALIAFLLASTHGGPASAQTDDRSTATLTGVVVSSGNTSLVVRTDDGAAQTLVIDTTTAMPGAGVAAGDHVTIRYRPLDASRSQAVSIAVVEAGPGTEASPDPSERTTTDPGRLPATASPMPLLGLLGLTALAGGLFLRMLARHAV
jgi:hypothetical protein